MLLSYLLWTITLSKKSRQADMVVTICQQTRASEGDTRLDEEGCGNTGHVSFGQKAGKIAWVN